MNYSNERPDANLRRSMEADRAGARAHPRMHIVRSTSRLRKQA